MRIIGGKYRGKILKEFKGEDIRPTSDRAREALFNILQFSIVGARFYDGFCGTGGVGIEALSRGADSVVMTDISSKSLELAKSNLQLVNEKATLLLMDATSFLENTDKTFNVIFLDPPYNSEKGVTALEIIARRKLLAPNGVAILEHKKGQAVTVDGLQLTSTRNYGICQFDFYKVQNG